MPPENFNNIALVSNVLKMRARSCEVHLSFYFDVAEMEKEEIITKLLNSFPGVRWTWSTSDKLSLEFLDQLPQAHNLICIHIYRDEINIFFLCLFIASITTTVCVCDNNLSSNSK